MALFSKKYNPVYLEKNTKNERNTPSTLKLALSLIIASALLVYPLLRPWYDYRPDFLLIVALYWSIQYPKHYQYGFMFILGVISDIFQSTILGGHAFIFPLTLYLLNSAVDVERQFNPRSRLKTMMAGLLIATVMLCLVFALSSIAQPLQPLLTIVPAMIALLFCYILLAFKQ